MGHRLLQLCDLATDTHRAADIKNKEDSLSQWYNTNRGEEMSEVSVYNLQVIKQENTVNSKIFARVLFSRNFAYAKFCENKILAKWRNHSLSFTDLSKSCPSRESLSSQICLLTLNSRK